MHRPKRVAESGVGCRRVDKPGDPKLRNVMESLELLQRNNFPNEIKPVKSDKAVNRVSNEKLFRR